MRAFAVLLISLGLVAGLAGCKPASQPGVATADDMSLGNPNAKVTMIEYASLGCPVCTIWNNTVFSTFKAKYIDTGKVHYVFREFLTGDAPVASAGFLLARCAGPGKYFPVIDAVFHAEQPLLETDQYAAKRDALVNIAESMGMTEQQFNACVTNDKAIQALDDRSQKWATVDKIESTPTFVIDGKVYDSGMMSMDQLDKAVADADAAAK